MWIIIQGRQHANRPTLLHQRRVPDVRPEGAQPPRAPPPPASTAATRVHLHQRHTRLKCPTHGDQLPYPHTPHAASFFVACIPIARTRLRRFALSNACIFITLCADLTCMVSCIRGRAPRCQFSQTLSQHHTTAGGRGTSSRRQQMLGVESESVNVGLAACAANSVRSYARFIRSLICAFASSLSVHSCVHAFMRSCVHALFSSFIQQMFRVRAFFC